MIVVIIIVICLILGLGGFYWYQSRTVRNRKKGYRPVGNIGRVAENTNPYNGERETRLNF